MYSLKHGTTHISLEYTSGQINSLNCSPAPTRKNMYHVQLHVDSNPHVWQLRLLKMVENYNEA